MNRFFLYHGRFYAFAYYDHYHSELCEYNEFGTPVRIVTGDERNEIIQAMEDARDD